MHYKIDVTGFKPEELKVEMHEAIKEGESPYVVVNGEHKNQSGGWLHLFS